jgi:superfamily I DNA and/or RNA helicase
LRRKFGSYREYTDHFLRLIALERKAQMDQHLKEIRRLTGKERERRGRAVLNMRARYMGVGVGGMHLVRYFREDMPETEISVGDVVLVSSGRPTGKEVQGTVYEKGKNYITVAFTEKPPPYALGKRVRIDLFSNETTFRRMEEALGRLKDHPLLPLLLGRGC